MPSCPLAARVAECSYLVRGGLPVSSNPNLAVASIPDMRLYRDNLFALFGFSHLAYLLSGHNAPAHRHAREVVLMASDWASHRATTPISEQSYSIERYRDCQASLSNRRWWGRIGGVV